MKNAIKKAVEALPVSWTLAIERAKRRIAPSPVWKHNQTVFQRLGRPSVVLDGPFKGMRYVSEAHGSAYLPKLLGTYEHELTPIFEQILHFDHDLVVDVGSAEGYYAVGLAIKLPQARVIGYDISRRARYLLKQLARLNDVSQRVEQRGRIDPPELERALSDGRRPLLIVDCEGYEDVLLQPREAPSTARASMLVELHDHLAPGASQHLEERFGSTHRIQVIHSNPLPPVLPSGFAEEERHYFREGRVVEQTWFWMQPREPIQS